MQEDKMLETIVSELIFVEEEMGFVEKESVSRASWIVCRKLLQTTGEHGSHFKGHILGTVSIVVCLMNFCV